MTTRQRKKNRREEGNREYTCTDEDFAQMMVNTKRSNEWQRVLWNMPFGVERRAELLRLLSFPNESLHVNRKWCPVLRHDRDLVKLLRAGKLVRTREGSHSTQHTVLRVPR